MSNISWEIHEEGVARVTGQLSLSARKAEDTAALMRRILIDITEIEKIVFSSGGRRGGGSWKRLSQSTVKKKGTTTILRTEGAKPGYSKIAGETSIDTLFHSLTDIGAPYQVLALTNTDVVFGTERPMAGRINQTRPFLRILPTDVDRWTRWMTEHIMAPFLVNE